MKKVITYTLFLLPLLTFLSTGCYNKFQKPEIKTHPELPARTISIAELKALYAKNGNTPYTVQHGVVIRGIVNSNDTQGNLYRTIHIQDETGGIECKMGMPNMSLLYHRGNEVAVKCEGLVLGNYGGQVNLGFKSNNPKYETGYVPEALVSEIMLEGRYVGITPIDLTIPELSTQYANMLIRLRDVQFIESELGQTYADPANKANTPSVNRTLVDKNGQRVIVRTSGYAQFAGKKLPEGSGDIIAILTFFAGTPQLLISDVNEDVDMPNPRF